MRCGKIWFSQTAHTRQAFAHCMLDNYGYRYTLRIRNTYSFSVAKQKSVLILNSVRQHNYFITQGNYIGYMFRP